jgi:hypothetical protein
MAVLSAVVVFISDVRSWGASAEHRFMEMQPSSFSVA